MGKSDIARIEALDAMLAEKRKHEGYLAKLEERRATTPEQVFARLRDEYLTKLTDLQVRASAEAESLTSGLEEDARAVSEIEARLAAATEERVEGELRAEVGEYEPKEWAKRLDTLSVSIAKLEKEREAKVASYERTRSLLAEARGSAEAPQGPVTSAPAAAATVMSPAATAASSAAAASPAAPAAKHATPEGTAVAASASAKSKGRGSAPTPSESSTAAPTTAAAGATSAPAVEPTPVPSAAKDEARPGKAAAPMTSGPSFDELAFLNSVVGRVSTPVRVDPPAPIPRSSRPVPEVRDGGAAPAPPAAPPARTSQSVKAPAQPITERSSAPQPDEPPSALGRPTPRSSQAIKTLKCQECGTLNYPTEWYCERCGGELAAL